MTRARQDRLLGLLARDGEWMTAATLADALGVTPRSIRSYVTALNARVPAGVAVESGPQGYRAGAEAVDRPPTTAGADAGTPRDRLHTLVRALLDAPDGIDVFETADACTSARRPSTPTSRACAGCSAAPSSRSSAPRRRRGCAGPRWPSGACSAGSLTTRWMPARSTSRRCAARSARDRSAPHAFGPFKTELVAELGALGYFVNEFGIADVVMHIAIAADRVAQRSRPRADGAARSGRRSRRWPRSSSASSSATSASTLGAGDLQHLVDARAHAGRRPRRIRAVGPRPVATGSGGRGGGARGRRDGGRRVPRRHRARGLHPAAGAARAEPPAPRARAGVVAQSADEIAEVDVPDDLRGRGLHRERPAASVSASRCSTTRSPTSRCTSADGSSAAAAPTSC